MTEAVELFSGRQLSANIEIVEGDGVDQVGASSEAFNWRPGVLTIQVKADQLVQFGRPVGGVAWLRWATTDQAAEVGGGVMVMHAALAAGAAQDRLSASGRNVLIHEVGHAMGFKHPT